MGSKCQTGSEAVQKQPYAEGKLQDVGFSNVATVRFASHKTADRSHIWPESTSISPHVGRAPELAELCQIGETLVLGADDPRLQRPGSGCLPCKHT